MERKVGEIFEYNGEWYQCVEGIGCYKCAFYDKNICIANNPHCTCRSDKKNVIFKKLEKVGEPYAPINNSSLLLQRYQAYIPVTKINSHTNVHTHGVDNVIAIEIKQNKKDMEEKKLNLRPFDLEAAKAGKPVCTRDGRKARIICFDAKCDKPIIALIYGCNKETVLQYLENGRFFVDQIDKYDLMMLPQKKEGWVNVYKSYNVGKTIPCMASIYPTKEEAKKSSVVGFDYVDTVKIEWEE